MINNKLALVLLATLILIVAGCLDKKSYAPSVSSTPIQKIKPQPIPNCIGGLCKANLSVIIVKNIVTNDTCNNNTVSHTSLNHSEITDMKYVISAFVSEVYNSTDGRFILNPIYHEIPEVKVNICKEFWMGPWDIYPYVKNNITKDIDFVIVYFDNRDDITGTYKFINNYSGATFGSLAGINGSGFTSIGLRWGTSRDYYVQSTFHEWLHQLAVAMFESKVVEFKYINYTKEGAYSADYPPCGKAINDTFLWHPSADDYEFDPDWKYWVLTR